MGLRRALRDYRNRRALAQERAQKAAETHLPYAGLSVPIRGAHMLPELVNVMRTGDYERHEIEAVRSMVRPGDRVLELGTGIGVTAALVARAAGPTGQVRTYEANAALFAPAAELFRTNGIDTVDMRHAVLVTGDTSGSIDFHIGPVFTESGLDAPPGTSNRHAVPAVPLAEVMAEFRPDVFVCDIEGAEAEVVPALDAATLRAAVIELHPGRISRAQVAAIYTHLARHRLFPMIEHSGGNVVAFERVDG